jgi:ABC-2 type transport system permease protein
MVQLLTEFEKLVSVLLYRYARAEVLNAFTFGLVHAPESIAASAILSMFDVERKSKFCTGPTVQQDSAIGFGRSCLRFRCASKVRRLDSIRHRSAFVMTLVGVFTELAAFYFLSRAIGPSFRPGGIEYFPFLLVGTGLYTFFLMSAQAFLSSVQEAQQTGTLEVLMTTSTAPAELIILSSISSFSSNLVNLAIYLLAGVAIFRATIHANLLSCVLVLILSLLIGLAVGIAAATLQVAFQKGSAVLWLLSSGLWFLSGATFPIQSLPRPLELLARALPLTYAIEAMRGGLLEGRSVAEMAPTLTILAGFVVVLLPLSLGGLSMSLRHARQNGTLSFY